MRSQLSIVCLLVAGCSLPSTAAPIAGAPAEEQVGGGIHRIAVPASGLADCATADECTLVKAAQATQRVGGTHFIVLPGHGGSAQSGYAYIKVFTFGADERVPSSAMSASEALHFIRRPQGQVAS